MIKLDQYVSTGLQNTVRVVRAPGRSEGRCCGCAMACRVFIYRVDENQLIITQPDDTLNSRLCFGLFC